MQKILLTALFITSVSIATETPSYAYVYDDGLIPLRYEKEIGNNTVLSLQNGEQVDVLEVSDDGKWSKVKYGTTEGWIVSKFIVPGISAKDKLSQLVNENKQLSKLIKELKEHHNELEKYNNKAIYILDSLITYDIYKPGTNWVANLGYNLEVITVMDTMAVCKLLNKEKPWATVKVGHKLIISE